MEKREVDKNGRTEVEAKRQQHGHMTEEGEKVISERLYMRIEDIDTNLYLYIGSFTYMWVQYELLNYLQLLLLSILSDELEERKGGAAGQSVKLDNGGKRGK